MAECPNCGEEVSPDITFCNYCGYKLSQEPETRTKIIEHLKYALNCLKENRSILYPQLVLTVFGLILAYGYSLFGVQNSLEALVASLEAGESISEYYPLIFLGGISILGGSIISIFFSPFLQHVYLVAVRDNEVDFKASYEYMMSRIIEFVKANFLVIFTGLLILGIPMASISLLFNVVTAETTTWLYAGIGLFLVVGLFVIVCMVGALEIMVWDHTQFWQAFRLGIRFLFDRFWTLVRWLLSYCLFMICMVS